MIYTIKCPNCNEEIEINESLLNGEDEFYDECQQCGYPLTIGIEYDENDNIIKLYVD